MPDGEPGDRANWVLTQTPALPRQPDVRRRRSRRASALARLRPGTTAADVGFPAFDYQDHAIASYALFAAARERGELAPDSKFLVSIPTPFNAVNFFVEFDSQVEVARAYELPLKDSVDAIQAAIPHRDLVIQWDLPVEDATVEGWFPNPYRDFEEIYAATARPASWVHDDVELTFHLCYGDSKFGASPFMGDPPDEEAAARGGRHVYPRDASVIVAVANGLSRHVPRRIDAISGGHGHDVEQAGALAAARQPRDRTRDRVLPRAGARRGRRRRSALPGRARVEVPAELRTVDRVRARDGTRRNNSIGWPRRSRNCSRPRRRHWRRTGRIAGRADADGDTGARLG